MTDNVQGFWDAVLMVRDFGYPANPNVEFWFYAGDQSINFGFIEFEKRVNNVTTSFWVGIPSYAGWVRVSTDNAIWSQYVTFQLNSNLGIAQHGSADPGYPYSYSPYLTRPNVPDPPSRPYIFNIGVNAVNVGWDPPENNGGATILEYQIGYGTNFSGPTFTVSARSGDAVSNLAMGTLYYFWVRARNYEGWSNWSGVNSARIYIGAYVHTGGVWKLAIPYVNVAGIWREAEPKVHHS